jgi:YD repeat-containing protein
MDRRKILGWICLVALFFAASPAQAVVVNYAYDGAGRLITADYGFGKSIVYAYDQGGNLLRQSVQFGLSDVLRILQVLAGIQPQSAVSQSGDVNADGRIGLAEILYILQTVSALREQ